MLEELRSVLQPRLPLTVGDDQLIERFVQQNDSTAFAELVRRHGPMVLSVCRRILRHCQDAEDAFQAVFLVLAHKPVRFPRGKSCHLQPPSSGCLQTSREARLKPAAKTSLSRFPPAKALKLVAD